MMQAHGCKDKVKNRESVQERERKREGERERGSSVNQLLHTYLSWLLLKA